MSVTTPEQKKAISDRMTKYWADKRANEIKKEKPVDTGADAPLPTETSVVASPMTPEEKAIFSRVASESMEWATIDPTATLDYSLADDPFKLPEPAIKLQKDKQFQFKWIERISTRLDEVKNKQVPFRWWPVNNMQPVGGLFKDFVDSSTGAVHLMDQMLVFKPWWMWEKEREIKNKIADTRGDLTSKNKQKPTDNIELAATIRKTGDPRQRPEITGNDIQFRGEAEIDRDMGIDNGYADMNDLVVNE